MPPTRLVFEITESVAMQDAELSSRVIRAFRAHGFGIAIDDFGTGYSSLAYLQQFRAQQLKIDRFFTQGLAHMAKKAAPSWRRSWPWRTR